MRTNDLVKTVGEGDWGEEGDLENPDAQTQPAYTDWLVDFTGAGPPIVSSGPEDNDGTRLDQPDLGPQPGPSTRPMSTRDLPAGPQLAGGKLTLPSVQEEDISRVEDRLPSVSGQQSREQHLQMDTTLEHPRTEAKPTVPGTRSYKPLERQQD